MQVTALMQTKSNYIIVYIPYFSALIINCLRELITIQHRHDLLRANKFHGNRQLKATGTGLDIFQRTGLPGHSL